MIPNSFHLLFLVDRLKGISYTIGIQEYAFWMNMNSTDSRIPSIVYPSPSINRRLIVQLICDRSYSTAQLSVLGETSLGEYTMQLTSRCACWNECNQPKPDPEPFSWNFWIILVSISGVVFLFFCIVVSCLFCTKPKRRYPMIITDENTALFAVLRKH